MALEQVVGGVHRLGTEWVNWYLLVADEGVTVVDCGFSGYHGQLHEALEALGMRTADVKAVVLTHYHSDHVGSAQRISEESGAPVYAPELDAEGVRTGKVPAPSGLIKNMWRPRMLRYLAHAMRSGVNVKPVTEVVSYSDGEHLPVPGALCAVHTPGHSAGHCSLVAPQEGVLFAGDALSTTSFVGGPEGPQLPPANEDHGQARASLERLHGLEATHVCCGHGPPFAGSPGDAAAAALAR